jgi:probable HAF family extracellular repeat protein
MQQLSTITKTLVLTSFSALSLFAVAPVQAASFRGLGFLGDGHYSSASGVSADGSVVVGNSGQAFRWTQLDGMVSLGSDTMSVSGVSANGSVIVGSSESQAVRWTQETGIVGLGSLAGGIFLNSASGVSADGSVIVGNSGNQAARWTQESGTVGLGFLPYSYCWPPYNDCGFYPLNSSANAVSADGSVVVGGGSIRNGSSPFFWTQGSNPGLNGLGEYGYYSKANGVSANGSVIVGVIDTRIYTNGGSGYEAFRWTQSSGMVWLDDRADGHYFSEAKGVSADGSIVVGISSFERGSLEAFHWTQGKGMVSLKETLIGAGLDVSGWTLNEATGISADGFTIVGNGINPLGKSEAWVANLSPEPIPEPLTILGSIAAIGFAAGFERKFNKNKSDEKDPDA